MKRNYKDEAIAAVAALDTLLNSLDIPDCVVDFDGAVRDARDVRDDLKDLIPVDDEEFDCPKISTPFYRVLREAYSLMPIKQLETFISKVKADLEWITQRTHGIFDGSDVDELTEVLEILNKELRKRKNKNKKSVFPA
jgi:hypothetical protein